MFLMAPVDANSACRQNDEPNNYVGIPAFSIMFQFFVNDWNPDTLVYKHIPVAVLTCHHCYFHSITVESNIKLHVTHYTVTVL